MTKSTISEAVLNIGGKEYPVRYTMSTLGHLERAFEVEGFDALREIIAKMRFADMPKIVKAILDGNGYDLSEAEIDAGMDPVDYLSEVASKIFFRPGPKKDDGENPPKGQRKK